jgi:hypothetical protein
VDNRNVTELTIDELRARHTRDTERLKDIVRPDLQPWQYGSVRSLVTEAQFVVGELTNRLKEANRLLGREE